MDAMENGSNQETPIDQNFVPLNRNIGFDHEGVDSGGGIHVKGVSDQNLVPLGFRLKNSNKIDGKSNPNFGYRASNGYSSYIDGGSDEETDNGCEFGGGNLVPTEFRAKKFGTGIRIKTSIDQSSMPPTFKAIKFGKIDLKLNPNFDCDNSSYDAIDADGGHRVKIPSDRNSVAAGTKGKFSGKTDRNSNSNFDPRASNGFSSEARPIFEKKTGSGGVKRGRGPVEDMISSIKLLGGRFVKMDKMKMEMVKESEKNANGDEAE